MAERLAVLVCALSTFAAAQPLEPFEFKTGARHAGNAALMKPVVEKLSLEDLTAIAFASGSTVSLFESR